MSQPDADPEFIMIDNCYHWRNKLQETCPNSKVKVDLFHAVQRLTSQVSKRPPFHRMVCVFQTIRRSWNQTEKRNSHPVVDHGEHYYILRQMGEY